MKSDLTIVYYTANKLPKEFARTVRNQLTEAIVGTGILGISLGNDTSIAWNGFTSYGFQDREELPYSHFSIYKLALLGAKIAKTKYIALCEDDVLYSPEHFAYRPKKAPFAYNMNFWNVCTWGDPMFTQKLGGRRNLGQLICEREAFIEAMEERFKKYPKPEVTTLLSSTNDSVHAENLKDIWGEPSKYEKQLGVTVQEWEPFYTNPPNVMFSHQTSLSYQGLGERKRLGEIRATEIPSWGRVRDIRAMYE